MLGSAVLGVVATMPPGDTVKSFVAGFGSTAGAVGILIALGAMIGKLLEDSGGANRIVATMVGALILARAVDDQELSRRILGAARARLSSP